MSQYLKDKVIIVTGAGGGFGKLISEKCAAGGAKVVGVDINADNLNEVIDGLTAAGFEGTAHVADVTDMAQVKAAAQHAVDTYGAIHVLVNNAGVMPLAFSPTTNRPGRNGTRRSISTSRASSTASRRSTTK
jgi:NAD(P)-dependent dehydrogenase (short-subunit alcohol dehydrogenase family)